VVRTPPPRCPPRLVECADGSAGRVEDLVDDGQHDRIRIGEPRVCPVGHACRELLIGELRESSAGNHHLSVRRDDEVADGDLRGRRLEGDRCQRPDPPAFVSVRWWRGTHRIEHDRRQVDLAGERARGCATTGTD
jgi:hypothetical protein